MNRKELLQSAISATMTKEMVADIVSLAEEKSFGVFELYEYCFHTQAAMAFRAAWILEHIAFNDSERFAPVLPLFLSQFPKQKNLSCQRHFTKILLLIIDKKAPDSYKAALASSDREHIVSCIFDWLVSDQTPIAVKANCMEILVHFCREFEWVREELALTIEQVMDLGSSPALFSRGKRVLYKLRKMQTR